MRAEHHCSIICMSSYSHYLWGRWSDPKGLQQATATLATLLLRTAAHLREASSAREVLLCLTAASGLSWPRL